ncbi:MAG: sugar phosphate isomerase/epimerase [Verrucomicrobiae bacterium]|nr:sugar phosphate isomerase/epimerase [Verrucomicrobiae bacterium]
MKTIPSAMTRRAFLTQTAALGAVGLAASRFSAAAGECGGWQIGCYTRPWDQVEYRVALDAIAEAGYKFCGLMTTKAPRRLVISVDTTLEEARQIGDECRQRGLTPVSVYGGGFPVQKSIEAGIEGLKKLIDNVAAAKAGNLLLGGTNEKLSDAYYKVVAECCDYAALKGVGMSVKPHGGNNANGSDCRKIVEKVGHKSFRIWYDPGNIFFYSNGKLNPVDDAAVVDGMVVGMCVKDYRPAKADPAAPPKKSPYGGEVMLTPGTGQVNFKAVLARLKKGGFSSGPLIVECLDRSDPAKLTAEAKKARLFVEEIVRQI